MFYKTDHRCRPIWPNLVDFGQIWLILAVDFWPNLVDFWPMHNGGAILLRQQDFIFGYVFQPFEQLPNFVFSTKERKKEREKLEYKKRLQRQERVISSPGGHARHCQKNSHF